ARLGSGYQVAIEARLVPAPLVAGNQQDGDATQVECEGDPPYTADGGKAQLLQVRDAAPLQGVDQGRPGSVRTPPAAAHARAAHPAPLRPGTGTRRQAADGT